MFSKRKGTGKFFSGCCGLFCSLFLFFLKIVIPLETSFLSLGNFLISLCKLLCELIFVEKWYINSLIIYSSLPTSEVCLPDLQNLATVMTIS